jgi:hypothetical protein
LIWGLQQHACRSRRGPHWFTRHVRTEEKQSSHQQ